MVKIAGRENPDLLQQVLTFDTEVNETTCNFYVLRRRGEEPDMFLDMPVVLAWAKAYQTALKAHLYVSQFPVVRDEFKNYLLQHGVPPDFVSDDSWVSRIDRLFGKFPDRLDGILSLETRQRLQLGEHLNDLKLAPHLVPYPEMVLFPNLLRMGTHVLQLEGVTLLINRNRRFCIDESRDNSQFFNISIRGAG